MSTKYSPANRTVTITAVASDSAWSKANVATAQQSVTEIRAFVNIHPYTPNNAGFLLVNAQVIVDVSSYQDGRYSVYVQAKDSAVYRGPVTATYFVKSSTAQPSSTKPTTASPTTRKPTPARPTTRKPTLRPTRRPSSTRPTSRKPTLNI